MSKKEDKDTALEPVKPAGPLMKNEDLLAAGGEGTEGLGPEDVKPPRLALAQSGSPQVKRDNLKRIEGLREGDLFNSLTGQVYGPGPIDIVVIRFLGLRGIQFRPMTEGGGVVDFNVSTERRGGEFVDPRMRFTDGQDGQRIKPVATLFYDYLVLLPATGEVTALSFKSTSIKAAVFLNSLIKYPLRIDGLIVAKPPAWARTFALGTAMQSDKVNTWANFTVTDKGITDPEVRSAARQLYAQYAQKNVVIDHADESEEPAGDDTPF